MRPFKPGGSHSTPYIQLDTHKCVGCFKCVEVCPKDVIGKVHILWHKHAIIRQPEKCIGCYKCVKVCEVSAITKK